MIFDEAEARQQGFNAAPNPPAASLHPSSTPDLEKPPPSGRATARDAIMDGSSSESEHMLGLENGIAEHGEGQGSHQTGQQETSGLAKLGAENNDAKVYEGMVFQSEDDAYEKYNEYARKIGFSIRKSKVYKRANGVVRCRYFVCYKEGFREPDRRRHNPKKKHKEIRTGCMARMVIKRGEDEEFFCNEFVSAHNHPLATPLKSYMLRSHRKLIEAGTADLESLITARIRSGDDSLYMTQPVGGPASVGIANTEYKNFIRNKRMEELGIGDASALLNYFIKKKSENSGFFYAIMVDDENQLTNFFWADAMSIIDYNHFGDVVVFDTTYRTNKYGRAFAPFVGVNHHKQTIIFGGALLLDETTESFIWLFETWMKAVSGKKPKTILTDQCDAITKAISVVLPETQHRLCLWHICQNAAKNLSHVYEAPGFSQIFKNCIYNCETEEELFRLSDKMLQNYDLVNNKWLAELFEVREKWALVYGRDTFCADMTTTERSESINEFLKKFVKKTYSLREFVKRYDTALSTQRHTELEKDYDLVRVLPKLLVVTRMLKQAADIYTHATYEMFENEYKEHLMCGIEDCGVDGITYEYVVAQENHTRGYVKFDSSNSQVVCSCKKFEFVGIVCRHIIKVFYHNNVHDIPTQYFLKRWTRDAKSGLVTDQSGNPIQAYCNADISVRYNEIFRKAVNLATKGAINEEAYLAVMHVLDDGFKKLEAVVKASQEASREGLHWLVPTIPREQQLIANLYPQSHAANFAPDFNEGVHQPSTHANLQPYLDTVGSEFTEEPLRTGGSRLSPYRHWNFNHDKHMG